MLEGLTAAEGDAIPIRVVSEAMLPAWLEKNPESRDWVSAMGFKGEPGALHSCRVAARVRATHRVADGGRSRFGRLPGCRPRCPREPTALEAVDGSSHSDVALGWALGSYAFTKYKKAKRSPAKLVWPAKADRAEVETCRAGRLSCARHDQHSCRGHGPAEVADHVRSVGDAFGAKTIVIAGDELLQQNYPTIHIVGRASFARPPRLIDMRWGRERSHGDARREGRLLRHRRARSQAAREAMLEMKRTWAALR